MRKGAQVTNPENRSPFPRRSKNFLTLAPLGLILPERDRHHLARRSAAVRGAACSRQCAAEPKPRLVATRWLCSRPGQAGQDRELFDGVTPV
jgi:hypothetical protein